MCLWYSWKTYLEHLKYIITQRNCLIQQMQIMIKKECIKRSVLCDTQLSFSFKNPQRIWHYSV